MYLALTMCPQDQACWLRHQAAQDGFMHKKKGHIDSFRLELLDPVLGQTGLGTAHRSGLASAHGYAAYILPGQLEHLPVGKSHAGFDVGLARGGTAFH